MANPSDRICLDSNVIIDCLDKTDPWWSHIEPILREAEKNRLAFVMSVIAKAEVLTISSKTPEESLRIINSFFRQTYAHIYGVNERTAEHAATIRRRINLDPADSLHLATAVEHKIPILLTRDGEGTKKRRKKKLIDANNMFDVEIITPEAYFDRLGDDVKQSEISDIGDSETTNEDRET